MSNTSKMIRESIVFAIDELRKNLSVSALADDVINNAQAIKILSEAYKNIK